MDHFNREKHRPHNKWAVIELVVPSEHDHESCRQFHHSTVSDDEIDAPETNETDLARRLDVKWEHGRPQLTIRMHPISVPNTRSYMYAALSCWTLFALS